jgi:serine/tyrosine/threonine adenylyltransferase
MSIGIIDEPRPALIAFDNSYARLPDRFAARLAPTPVPAPRLVRINAPLARDLGIDPAGLATQEGIEILAGNRIAQGSEPLAMAYAGHQFGGFVPQLGDGRAILLGEVIGRDGHRRDIQLKGSGQTPFSRRGDGRAALGPVMREYIISEAMAALAIPTTRSLAVVTTGEPVYRETAVPGAVLTRVASSHIRVGTFQYFAARRDIDGVRTLADHVIARHYPEAAHADHLYIALLDAVIGRQAALVARWMLVGFIHGVMNTDNCSIAGETIDYGPCAFMDGYHPGTVYSSIDHAGRYAFGNQPAIAQWNLARFAETLLPVLSDTETTSIERAQASLANFTRHFAAAHDAGLRAKLGLDQERPGDPELAQDLFDRMAASQADFTLTFRNLADASTDATADDAVRRLFRDPSAFDGWAVKWRDRLAAEGRDPAETRDAMRRVNPKYIPRNHRVEEALDAAVQDADFAPFERLLTVLAAPFDDQPQHAAYANPPLPDEVVQQTFCGT